MIKWEKIAARDLRIGDVIRPPKHERGWLKNLMIVVSPPHEGEPDKRGAWIWVKARFRSPYNPDDTRPMNFKMRPGTIVRAARPRRGAQLGITVNNEIVEIEATGLRFAPGTLTEHGSEPVAPEAAR